VRLVTDATPSMTASTYMNHYRSIISSIISHHWYRLHISINTNVCSRGINQTKNLARNDVRSVITRSLMQVFFWTHDLITTCHWCKYSAEDPPAGVFVGMSFIFSTQSYWFIISFETHQVRNVYQSISRMSRIAESGLHSVHFIS